MTLIPADDLRQITESIWFAIAGLAVEPVDSDVVCARTGATFEARVDLTGAWKGAIALQCSAPLARRVAAAIFDVDVTVATVAQTQDAVGELVNMTGGNVKALLPEPSQLSLPTVVQGRDFTATVPGSRLAGQIAFACDGEPLLVTVLERDESAPAPRVS